MTATTEKWVVGALNNVSAFAGADLNNLASGSAVLSSAINGGSSVDNSTNLDIYGLFSISLSSITIASPLTAWFGIYYLNEDGSTYGDGAFVAGTGKAQAPSPIYWAQSIVFSTAATATVVGTTPLFRLLPKQFIPIFYNQLGVATASNNSSVIKMTTFNRQQL